MSNNSTILIPQTTYTGPGSQTLNGEKFKGDGYYGRTDGLHTVQINTTGFTGAVSFQGTLEIDPGEQDWSTIFINDVNSNTLGSVDTTGAVVQSAGTTISALDLTNNTGSLNYNFTGNYVWVRARITDWTQGIVNSIYMNN
jgi:hypothetical protein